jgi:signal transduction histidine kinase/PAS domain-containing protein
MNTKIKHAIPALTASILLILSVYATSQVAVAQTSHPATSETLILTDEQGKYPLGLYMELLEDPSGKLTIEDISSPAFNSRFIPSHVATPNFGFTESAYWMRLHLQNQTLHSDHWMLEINYPQMQFVDLYSLLPSGEGFTVKQSGVLRPPKTRDVRHPHIIFSLVIPTQSQQTIYMRFQNGASMTLPLTLWEQKTFINNAILEQALMLLFYGVLVGLLIYNIFLLFSLREASYLYLVLFLASYLLWNASYDGYTETYLVPRFYYLKIYYYPLVFSSMFVTMVLFSDTILELKSRLFFFHRIVMVLVSGWGILVLLIPFINYLTTSILFSIWALTSIVIVMIAGIMVWKQGYIAIRYFMSAWFGLLACFILILLVRLGIIPSSFFAENIFRVGTVWMAVCWSIALADRINLLKAETTAVNRNLKNSEHRLSQILEGMPLGVAVYGKDQKSKYFNQRMVEIVSNPAQGIQPDLEDGHTLAQAMEYFSLKVSGTGENYPLENVPLYSALHGEPASVNDIEANIGDKHVPLEIWASPVRDDAGNVDSVVAVIEDITRRRQTEAELASHRKHLEALVEIRTTQLEEANQNLQLGLEWLSELNKIHQNIIGEVSLATAYNLLSARIHQVLGATLVFIVRWENQSEQSKVSYCYAHGEYDPDTKIIKDSFQKDSPLRQDIELGEIITCSTDQVASLSGSLREYFQNHDIQLLILAPLMIRQSVIGALGVAVTKPQQKFLIQQADLVRRMALDISSLTQDAIILDQALFQAAAEERDHLARDLHDSVTQTLFSANILTEVLPQIWRNNPEEGLQKLNNLQRLTRGALAEMRTFLLELRPSALINTPLNDLLAQLAEAVSIRSALLFQLFIEKTPILPENVQINFYRIAQEALNNVVKHAQADEVTMSLSAIPLTPDSTGRVMYEINLTIRDDGIGYFIRNKRPTQLGIGIMYERAESIQANLSMKSRPGSGTQITLTWCGENREV